MVDPALVHGMLKKSKMKLGLVTYQWGKDWDLPTLIANCEKAGFEAVELRTEHAHGVETSLTASQRAEVKKRFADSPVTCVGYGSNFDYHHVDQERVKQNIQGTKEYLKLCKDIGATGIKVKPNGLPEEVSKEKTIAQIATSLNECGKYASDLGQLIRVEVHGRLTQQLPNMKAPGVDANPSSRLASRSPRARRRRGYSLDLARRLSRSREPLGRNRQA